MRAMQITTLHIQAYVVYRHEAGVANATIHRELAALKRMFRLAAHHSPPLVMATAIPHIPRLRKANVRTGFFTEEEYQVL